MDAKGQHSYRTMLHVFGQCSHWTQIEYAEEFERLLRDFFLEEARR